MTLAANDAQTPECVSTQGDEVGEGVAIGVDDAWDLLVLPNDHVFQLALEGEQRLGAPLPLSWCNMVRAIEDYVIRVQVHGTLANSPSSGSFGSVSAEVSAEECSWINVIL